MTTKRGLNMSDNNFLNSPKLGRNIKTLKTSSDQKSKALEKEKDLKFLETLNFH